MLEIKFLETEILFFMPIRTTDSFKRNSFFSIRSGIIMDIFLLK